MRPYRVDFDLLEWESPMPGVRHKMYRSGSTGLRLVEYSQEMEPHWCDRGHVGYVLAGRFEIEFTAGTKTFEAGDGVFIPGGAQHRHRGRVVSDVVRAVFVEEV